MHGHVQQMAVITDYAHFKDEEIETQQEELRI